MKLKSLTPLLFLIAAGCASSHAAIQSASSSAATILSPYNTQIEIGDNKLNVQIVSSAADMQQGLSGRTNMPANDGMLFDFGAAANSAGAFWMKDMNFNLDFIWIKNHQVVGVTYDAPAPIGNWKLEIENLPLYYPPSPIDEVIEVNAGWAKENNIRVGDAVK